MADRISDQLRRAISGVAWLDDERRGAAVTETLGLQVNQIARDSTGVGAPVTKLESMLLGLDGRCRITTPEVEEARSRANLLKAALTTEFGAPTYLSGSLQHGDALTPLDDIDLGVILDEPLASAERARSPELIMGHVSRMLKSRLGRKYPHLTAGTLGQKRSVLIRFDEQANQGDVSNFTADVIVALRHSEGVGILVPNLRNGTWDRSDPVRHNEMMRDANIATGHSLNQVVRIAKLWNRAHDLPLASWNIKALCLMCITRPSSLTNGLRTFLQFALKSLSAGPTLDPAGVSAPIDLDNPKELVLQQLEQAKDAFERMAAVSNNDYDEFLSIARDFFGQYYLPT